MATTSSTHTTAAPPRHLHSARGDFWGLGGLSLFVVPIALLLPASSLESTVAKIATLVSFALNYPHFAVSYRIFYEDFGRKASVGRSTDPHLHLRYRIAGLAVPVALTLGLGGTILAGDADALGYSYNAMLLFVGWHYVKQGYGMAMVDAALKRRYFDDPTKRLLRANAYAAWATAWLTANRVGGPSDFLDVPVRTFDIPSVFFWCSVGVLAVTTALTARTLLARYRTGTPTPWTGVVAYAMSLYPWMVLIYWDALLLLVVPALHSLQYLWVVSRYQQNRAAADPKAPSWRSAYGWSVLAGAVMFWVVPLLLDSVGLYDTDAFGEFAFLFAFWIGINVHHYFLDNVMWRRGNPDVQAHLFA